MKTKYLFKETYFKLLIFIFITFLLTSCQENQYDSNGFKDGTWTEYIIGDGSKEVIKLVACVMGINKKMMIVFSATSSSKSKKANR